MNVFHVVVHPTVALSLNVTYALLNVTAPLVKLVVVTHTPSVHVNATVPV